MAVVKGGGFSFRPAFLDEVQASLPSFKSSGEPARFDSGVPGDVGEQIISSAKRARFEGGISSSLFHGNKRQIIQVLEWFHDYQGDNQDHEDGWYFVYDPVKPLRLLVLSGLKIPPPAREHAMQARQDTD